MKNKSSVQKKKKFLTPFPWQGVFQVALGVGGGNFVVGLFLQGWGIYQGMILTIQPFCDAMNNIIQ